MTGYHYIVIGLCLVLLLWLLVQEVRRHRRSLLAARVVAVVLAVGALACMALPLGHFRERQVAEAVGQAPKSEGRLRSDGMAAQRAPPGIVAVDWQRRLEKGERLRVQGRWGGGKVKMLLMGMGEVLDSAAVTGEFELMTTPAVMGRAVYGLVVLSGSDTLDREEVPVEVSHEKPLKVLVLANSPDFENTFLMNWLGKEGNAVEARVAVSRGKIEQSFVNMKGRMSDGFDLVIADSSMVTADLWRQVEEKRLGLLIRVDPSVRIGRPGMRVLARDSAGRAVVGEVLAGAGKVIYSASNMSYSLWLAGRKEEYAGYWAMLLREAAREGESGDEWKWQPGLSRVGEPVELELASGKDMPAGIVGRAAVYLAQDAAFPWVWRGRYWPVSAGWQEAWVPGGDTSWGYAGKGMAVGGVVGGKTVREWVAFPTWILYVIFLLCMFFLWVERKMGGMSG